MGEIVGRRTVETERQARATQKRRRRHPYRLIIDWLGDDFCGNKTPPGQQVRLERPLSGVYVADYHEDGGTLWIGYSDQWLVHMGGAESLRLARFIIWQYWIRATWLGLKRRIWHWALSRDLDRTLPLRGRDSEQGGH